MRIVATGTIVCGTPHRSSDLDVYVIHNAPFRRRVQRFFGDHVPTEIFINPPSAIRAYFTEEHADGRPLTAHMLATGHVVLERGPELQQLCLEAVPLYLAVIAYAHSGCVRTACVPRSLRAMMRDGASPCIGVLENAVSHTIDRVAGFRNLRGQ